MNNSEQRTQLSEHIAKAVMEAKNEDEMFGILHTVAFTLGALVVNFPPDEQGIVLMHMNKTIADSLMGISQKMGKECHVTMIVKEEPTIWQ